MDGSTRREQILRAAGSLFSSKGYHATSMRDIAEALGLQAGSLYNHIKGKEELLFGIVDFAADQFQQAVRPIVEADEDASLRLRRAMAAHIRVVAENLPTATVFFHEWHALDPDLRSRIAARRNEYEGLYRRLIADGIRRGEFRPVDDKFAGILVLSIVNWVYQWYSPEGPLGPEDLAEKFAALLLDGLRPRVD